MFLGHRADEGPWTDRDRELAKALHLFEAGICRGCGHPLDETTDPDREGWYLIDQESCAACRAVEFERAHSKHEHGVKLRPRLDPSYEKRS